MSSWNVAVRWSGRMVDEEDGMKNPKVRDPVTSTPQMTKPSWCASIEGKELPVLRGAPS
jgi:hypothetical protein